ncbi:MAG TPA: carbamoyltransferase HypF [Mycobacteriales bacterium]|nr:carbamoyltransferase HypF [Mycobacteriales bacterium]
MRERTDRSLRERRQVIVSGVVQGVGFRPFAYALARELGLAGSVRNTSAGVVAEVEGAPAAVAEFCRRIGTDAPPLAVVADVSSIVVPPVGGTEFRIDESRADGGRTLVSPDVATCPDCLSELADPADRRFRHPFITCTNCGPRFTIITGLPYDRAATTMARFPMCPRCAAEYADPADRRYHAQPIACSDCGPRLFLIDSAGARHTGEVALLAARRLLTAGAVVAVKGLGGYHLACDAENDTAVATLRKRKDRGNKPFALMVADLAAAQRLATVNPAEAARLTGIRRPIVLLERRPDAPIADSVAPGNPDLGVMLAYTPLHALLFGLPGDALGPTALVMTSGNVSGEPIVTDDAEARTRLSHLADAFLGHDRPIHVPCDDSVIRIVDGAELPVRRSRGYAPFPVALPLPVRPALAVGGDEKNTFCLGEGRYAWLSAHVGDMDDLATLRAFDTAREQLAALTGVAAELVVADRHPGYRSASWVSRAGPVVRVQHHHAHVAAVMAEHGQTAPVIGFAFDGTGYGDDGAVWGGEVLVGDYDGFRRAGQLRYAPLPGGDAGVRNPCRIALAQLHAAGLPWDADLPSVAACTEQERSILAVQLDRDLGCVPTSSMGRLFDAVSSLAGVCQRIGYEAQAAIELEGLARSEIGNCGAGYAFALSGSAPVLADPAPVLSAVIADRRAGVGRATVAARFHLAVVDLICLLAGRIRADTGLSTVALSGGVFLNQLLVSGSTRRLRSAGFTVLRHQKVPPSDAGLALGQLMIAARTDDRTSGR